MKSTGTSFAPTNLADILERVLDKGIVIAGDISVAVGGVDLLSIRSRLIIASVERAQEMGIDWWRSDPSLSSRAKGQLLDAEEHTRLLELENTKLRLELENAKLRLQLEGSERLSLEGSERLSLEGSERLSLEGSEPISKKP
jgi:Gas vesicle protein